MRILLSAFALLFLLWFGSATAVAAEAPAVEVPYFQQASASQATAENKAPKAQPQAAVANPPIAPPAQVPPQENVSASQAESSPAAPQATTSVDAPPTVTLPAVAEAPKPIDPDQYLMQAGEAYKAGELKKSIGLIDKAQLAIRTKHVELYRPLLPPTPKDWEAEDGKDSNIMMDNTRIGNISAIARKYTAAGYSVKVGYVVDSSMIGFLSSLLQVATTLQNDDTVVEDVQGNQAIYKENNDPRHKEAAHQLMVLAGDVMVVIQSETLPKETIMQFANIVPYEQLKAVQ